MYNNCGKTHYHVLTFPSAALEMLGFSQKSPVEFPISPTASLRGIRPPSSDFVSGYIIRCPYLLTSRLGRFAHLQSHIGINPSWAAAKCEYVVRVVQTRFHLPVDLKASILSGQPLGQSNHECLADAVGVLLVTSLGFLFLSNERLQISNQSNRSTT